MGFVGVGVSKQGLLFWVTRCFAEFTQSATSRLGRIKDVQGELGYAA
jgi:hypothetical protein